ncbi:oocyte zinc finger protein XlCOF8.4-like [Bufo bufo]|uniref:oocyte zinc finger protein XlCOF8.4-like n=1 Tax=Bufo bufo TaxID=8384 RepID=UPI001ABDCBC8|nr:oocyte zinc finger protein XlCOF8.4-like [Bufo bufo]
MNQNRKQIAEKILNLTLEIIYLLTGEDYIVVKTISDEDEGWSRNQIPIMKPPPDSLMNERSNEQKILELTSKITELLTGEVPVRCQDVAVYFNMEEWEYLKAYKDLYKDIMMENHQTLSSLFTVFTMSTDGLSMKKLPDGFSSPLIAHNRPEENRNVPQDYKIEELSEINYEVIIEDKEMSLEASQPCKEEEKSTDISAEKVQEDIIYPERNIEFTRSHIKREPAQNLEDHVFLSSDYTVDLYSDPTNHKESSCDQSPNGQQVKSKGGKIFTCSECGKNFKTKCSLCRHTRIHKNERPFLCSECGKCFIQRSHLVQHQKNHRGEKPFSCSECGKCFTQKSSLGGHQRIHTGEKPFSCPECSKCFNQKSDLVRHRRIHTGEKPYSCTECGKHFTVKSHLVEHQKNHTGDKPYSCSQCGKCFTQKAYLVKHEIIHTRKNGFHVQNVGNVLP